MENTCFYIIGFFDFARIVASKIDGVAMDDVKCFPMAPQIAFNVSYQKVTWIDKIIKQNFSDN